MSMSHAEIQVTAQKDDILVTVVKPAPVQFTVASIPGMQVIAAGNIGPPGPAGQWVSMTQAEYDALTELDPETLYVIVE